MQNFEVTIDKLVLTGIPVTDTIRLENALRLELSELLMTRMSAATSFRQVSSKPLQAPSFELIARPTPEHLGSQIANSIFMSIT